MVPAELIWSCSPLPGESVLEPGAGALRRGVAHDTLPLPEPPTSGKWRSSHLARRSGTFQWTTVQVRSGVGGRKLAQGCHRSVAAGNS
jgi:hypothetical protein